MGREKYEEFSKEELIKLIQKLKKKTKKKYGLIWEDHSEKINVDSFPMLKEVKDKHISSGGEENLLIEGDNYHSLRSLLYTHKNKIDVIYIDPPYNTGNEDFIYNDKIIDSNDLYRHSKWLSFMAKRLKIAKDLLKDDGMIFVSIDDNEQAQLKLLMDQIFGEHNFVNNIVVKMSDLSGPKMAHITSRFPKIKEYLLFYRKSTVKISPVTVPKEEWDKEYRNFAINFTRENYEALDTNDPKKFKELEKVVKNLEVIPLKEAFKKYNVDKKEQMEFSSKNAYRIFRTSNSKTLKRILDGFGDLKSKYKLVNKDGVFEIGITTYDKDATDPRVQAVFAERTLNQPLGDIWLDISTSGLHSEGNVRFKNGKKPLKLIKRIISAHTNKNATVLDFFAGSGTTGHAVLELNKEDGGNRKFILCTNNEVSSEVRRSHLFEKGLIPKNNNTELTKYKKENPDDYNKFLQSETFESLGIARAITHKRIKRVINGYTTPKGEEVEGLPGSLRYFKTKEVGSISKPTNKDIRDIIDSVEELIRIKHGTFNEIFQSNKISIYENDKEVVCYLKDIFSYDELIKKLKDNNKIKYVYIVSRDQETYEDAKQAIQTQLNNSVFGNIPEDVQRFFRQNLGGGK